MLLGGASAVFVEEHVLEDGAKFLQFPAADQQASPIETYEAFGQGDCQYIFNFAWYDFTNPTTDQPAMCSSLTTGDATACWNFCQDLSQTNLVDCSGPYWATMLMQNNGSPYCALNAVAMKVNDHQVGVATYPQLVYTNSNNVTNGGVESL